MTPSWAPRRSLHLGLALLAALASSTICAATPAVDACAWLAGQVSVQSTPAFFLASYPDAEPGPLRQAAFLYDNAVATNALTACDRIADARRIGDAMLLALDHDRYWHDGRLRNGYLAGAVGAAPVLKARRLAAEQPGSTLVRGWRTRPAAIAATWPGRCWRC